MSLEAMTIWCNGSGPYRSGFFEIHWSFTVFWHWWGIADTAIGEQNSKIGRSIIALYPTAIVKNSEIGVKEETSKIVPFLKQGAIVPLSRNDVDMVVTEYGIANLRGTSDKERILGLIEIAHPDFRKELFKLAVDFGIMIKKP